MSESEHAAEVSAVEAQVDRMREELRDWALHMVGKYNGIVYLMGSVLHSPTPRDIDVRIVVGDHEFGARYGMEMLPCDEPPTETRLGRTAKIHWDAGPTPQRWADDTAKFSAELSVKMKHNFDVKIWPSSYWRERTYPAPVILAAPSPRWFVYSKYVPDPTVQA